MTWNLDSLLQITLPIVALIGWFIRRLDKRFDKIDVRFDKIDDALKDHAEILLFIEAANIYTMPIEPAAANPRSAAAKEMWKRRRNKALEHKK